MSSQQPRPESTVFSQQRNEATRVRQVPAVEAAWNFTEWKKNHEKEIICFGVHLLCDNNGWNAGSSARQP